MSHNVLLVFSARWEKPAIEEHEGAKFLLASAGKASRQETAVAGLLRQPFSSSSKEQQQKANNSN